MRVYLMICSVALLSLGCTAVVELPPVPPDHPASPRAEEAPAPAYPRTLHIGEEDHVKSPAPAPPPKEEDHDHEH